MDAVQVPPYALSRGDLLANLTPLALAVFLSAAICIILARRVLAFKAVFGAGCSRTQLGTTSLEFALVLPALLSMVFVTIQLSLWLNALLVVDYAAFAAARSAAVWIPERLTEDDVNTLPESPDSGSEKWARIRRAAIIACVPISPRLSTFRSGLQTSVSRPEEGSLARVLAQLNASEGSQQFDLSKLARDSVDKWLYSDLFTDVTIVDADGQAATTLDEFAIVNVIVTHKFEMAVPFAGALLGRMFGDQYLEAVAGYYVPITASYSTQIWGTREAE